MRLATETLTANMRWELTVSDDIRSAHESMSTASIDVPSRESKDIKSSRGEINEGQSRGPLNG